MLKKSFLFALIASAAAAHGAELYNNTNVLDQDTFSTTYNHVADDFQFGGANSTYNPAVTISQLELGYFNRTSTPISFDMVVNFYQDMDISSTTGTTSILTGLAKSYRFHFDNEPSGANTTGLIDLANFGGVTNLPAVGNFTNDSHGIEVLFYNTGTTDLNTNARILFKGNHDPFVGYSYDTYARNNTTSAFVPTDRSNFSDPVFNRANFYMQLTGTVQAVPEPTSVAGLAVGALALLRRRKRA